MSHIHNIERERETEGKIIDPSILTFPYMEENNYIITVTVCICSILGVILCVCN